MKRETKADWKNAVKRRETGRVREARDILVRSIGSWAKAHRSMTLDKPFNLTVHQSSQLQNRYNKSTYLIVLLRGLNELLHAKHLEQELTLNKYITNVGYYSNIIGNFVKRSPPKQIFILINYLSLPFRFCWLIPTSCLTLLL